MHADPPVEHKAYLHRSGRTARAGATGTVVTLMLDAQVHDVRDLTRKAGIKPTITRIQPGHELLSSIAPGERTYVAEADRPAPAPAGPSGGGRGRGGRGGSGGQRRTRWRRTAPLRRWREQRRRRHRWRWRPARSWRQQQPAGGRWVLAAAQRRVVLLPLPLTRDKSGCVPSRRDGTLGAP